MLRSWIFLSFFIFLIGTQTSCYFRASVQGLDSSSNGQSDSADSDLLTLKPSLTELSLAEGDSDISYNSSLHLSINKAVNSPIEIPITAVSIYADNGLDYEVPASVTLPAGELSVSIPIIIKGDLLGEGSETFKLQFAVSNPTVVLNSAEVSIEILDNDPIVLSVNPMFPVFGSNFLNYVKRDLGQILPMMSDSTGCTIYNVENCIDGGAHRKVIAIGQHSCDELSLQDNLDVFNWLCEPNSDPVYFYSTGYKMGKGLKDLLNSSSFKNNFVVLRKNSTIIASSADLVWWTNPVVGLTLNSGGADSRLDLSTSGTIYTVSSSGSSRGFNLNSKVALVSLQGITVASSNPVAGDCSSSAGTQQCLIKFNVGADLSYLEGTFQATSNLSSLVGIGDNTGFPSLMGIRIHNTKLIGPGSGSTIGVTSYSTNINGFSITSSEVRSFNIGMELTSQGWYRYFKDITIANNTSFGIFSTSLGWYSKHIGLRLINNGSHGYTGSPYYSLWMDIIANNNGGSGLAISNSSDSIVKNILSVGNLDGAEVVGYDSVVSDISALNNTNEGVEMVNFNDGSKFYNILSANNNIGFINTTSSLNIEDLALVNNVTGLQFSAGSTGSSFHGKLILGNATNCTYVSAGANPGLTGVNCDNEGSSDAQRSLGYSLAGSFKGKVTAESVNTHITGLSLASSITDWINFESSLRLWAKEVAGDFISAARGRCTGATNCRIWDLEMLNIVSPILNVRGNFINQATCPSSIHGDVTEIYRGSPYLKYATEVIGDWIGNDNGLCESGETCIYSPNIGYFQGRGDYTQRNCVFENGVTVNGVTNVKMHAYPL